MPNSIIPRRPTAGDVCLICAHGVDVAVHFFYSPPQANPALEQYAIRPDGSLCGPVRWNLLCETCFLQYRHDAPFCLCADDLTWPEGLDDEVNLVIEEN
jgi:hypothetical protein